MWSDPTREEVEAIEPTIAEKHLLYWLRNRFRFGEVVIMVRDGFPVRILRAFESSADLDMKKR